MGRQPVFIVRPTHALDGDSIVDALASEDRLLEFAGDFVDIENGRCRWRRDLGVDGEKGTLSGGGRVRTRGGKAQEKDLPLSGCRLITRSSVLADLPWILLNLGADLPAFCDVHSASWLAFSIAGLVIFLCSVALSICICVCRASRVVQRPSSFRVPQIGGPLGAVTGTPRVLGVDVRARPLWVHFPWVPARRHASSR